MNSLQGGSMRLELSNEEVFEPVLNELRQLRSENQMIISLLTKGMALSGQRMIWKISDIAAYYGKSYDTLRTTERYLLPRFGQSAFPTGPARWPVEECLDWIQKPDEEKRSAYQEYVRQQLRAESRKRKAAN